MTEIVMIETSDEVVWVNDHYGCCIGRFSWKGVDVHHDGKTQLSLENDGHICLDCIHGLPFDESWERFKASMKKFHNVTVEDKHKPTVRGFR